MALSIGYVRNMLVFAERKLDDAKENYKRAALEFGRNDDATLKLDCIVSYWEGRVYTWNIVLAKLLAEPTNQGE